MTQSNPTRSNGDREACKVIFMSRPTKGDVIALALRLPDQDLDAATSAFHRQGPRLWGFWCAGLKARGVK